MLSKNEHTKSKAWWLSTNYSEFCVNAIPLVLAIIQCINRYGFTRTILIGAYKLLQTI